jgi:hypothetical protein
MVPRKSNAKERLALSLLGLKAEAEGGQGITALVAIATLLFTANGWDFCERCAARLRRDAIARRRNANAVPRPRPAPLANDLPRQRRDPVRPRPGLYKKRYKFNVKPGTLVALLRDPI